MVDTLITLFDDNETAFETQGLGSLMEATKCTVYEERNGEYELTMEYPVTGQHFKDLILRRIIFAKPNPHETPQPFRIYDISKPFHGIVTVSAHHISYDLSGYSIAPFEAGTSSQVFTQLNQQMAASWNSKHYPFTFQTDKGDIETPLNLAVPCSARALLGGSKGSILEKYKGEYKWDRWTVKLMGNRGQNRGVRIAYGKNLTDIEQEENCDNVWTGVYPYWYSEPQEMESGETTGGLVQLSEKIVYVEGEFKHERILILDLSSEFQDQPTEEELRARTKKYIEENKIGVPKVSINVSFVNLDDSEEYHDYQLLTRVYLCDIVSVSFPLMGIEAEATVIATTYNVLTDKYDSVQLGEAKSDLASTISDQTNQIQEEIDRNNSDLQRAIENATRLITGGLGGYVILHSSTEGSKYPDEILIMDKPDINDAVSVWRWNKNGLGYSSTGYNGPYGLAMTIDGRIVADYITAGVLNGAIIKAGSILATSLLVEYTNATSSVSPNGLSKDAQKTSLDWYLSAADMKLVITNASNAGEWTEDNDTLYETLYSQLVSRKQAMDSAITLLCGNTDIPSQSRDGIKASKQTLDDDYSALLTVINKIRALTPPSTKEALQALLEEYEMYFANVKADYEDLQDRLDVVNTDTMTYMVNTKFSVEHNKIIQEVSEKGYLTANSSEFTSLKTSVTTLSSGFSVLSEKVVTTTPGDKNYYGSLFSVTPTMIMAAFNQNNTVTEYHLSGTGFEMWGKSLTGNRFEQRFRLDAAGLMMMGEGRDVGWIGTTYQLDNAHTQGVARGITMNLKTTGDAIMWGDQYTTGQDRYRIILIYSRGNQGWPGYNSSGVQVNVPFYQNANSIYNANLEQPLAEGYTTVNNRRLTVVTDVDIDDDGNLVVTKAPVNIRSGMITSVPESVPTIEEAQ